MKKCFRCLIKKPLSEFYKHAQMKDGRLNKCKECAKADVRQNRLDRLDHYREFDRRRASMPHRVSARKEYQKTPEGKIAMARARRKYAVTHAIRRTAQVAVGNAVRDGRLEREPCFVCGERAQAHHPDYSRPLSVTWLCPDHHRELHRQADEILRREIQPEAACL